MFDTYHVSIFDMGMRLDMLKPLVESESGQSTRQGLGFSGNGHQEFLKKIKKYLTKE